MFKCYIVKMFQNQCDACHVVNGYGNGELLFDPSHITSVDWSCRKATFHGDISPHKPGENLVMRPLSVDDFDKGVWQMNFFYYDINFSIMYMCNA